MDAFDEWAYLLMYSYACYVGPPMNAFDKWACLLKYMHVIGWPTDECF